MLNDCIYRYFNGDEGIRRNYGSIETAVVEIEVRERAVIGESGDEDVAGEQVLQRRKMSLELAEPHEQSARERTVKCK